MTGNGAAPRPTTEVVSPAPPSDVPAEQVVIGCLLAGARLDDVGDLRPADFYRPAHALIFDAIADLSWAGAPVEPVAVLDELRRRGQLGRGVDGPYLHTCLSACPGRAFAGYYARITRDLAVRRRVVEIAAQLDQAARDYGDPGDLDERVDALVADLYGEVGRLAQGGES